MRTSTRWSVAAAVVAVAIGAALWAQLGEQDSQRTPTDTPTARDRRSADTPAQLAGPRAQAALQPCPAPGVGPGPAELRGITLECVGDGASVNVAAATAGRTVVLNLWAYWCGPCAQELPALAEYQRRVGPQVTVLTVHQDENETAALLRLAELGVHLPTLQDGRRLVAAALKVPNVMPATVILRSDGSVAEILPKPFSNADEIAAAVRSAVGSTTGVPG
jgi:thiol-disulfide isomerase/thioredoxin